MKRVMLVFGIRPIVHLVGMDDNKIMAKVSTLVDDAIAYKEISKVVNPYGKGLTCDRNSRF